MTIDYSVSTKMFKIITIITIYPTTHIIIFIKVMMKIKFIVFTLNN